MEITEVKVFPVREEKLKAFVSVVFDRCFMVNDIKIIQGRQGMFISMPSRKKKNGEFKDVAHPLNNDTRKMIEAEILGEYERVLEERSGERATPSTRPGTSPATDGEPTPAKRVETPELAHKAERATQHEGGSGETGRTTSAEAGRRPEPRAAVTEDEGGPTGGQTEGTAEDAKDATMEEESTEKTLEEVEEMHLRDSFWTVP